MCHGTNLDDNREKDDKISRARRFALASGDRSLDYDLNFEDNRLDVLGRRGLGSERVYHEGPVSEIMAQRGEGTTHLARQRGSEDHC
jgi:hypothetical protein